MTIYVTHDQVAALTLAAKIMLFSAAGVAQIGSPLELYRPPVKQFVAGFGGATAAFFLYPTRA